MSSAPNDTKTLFKNCGTCSQTFAHLINRAYKHREPMHERALDPLAGGIFREGHQCGMLWGACLATAAEAYRRCESLNEARALTLHASAELIASFEDQNHSIACREITGVKMNSFFGLLKFMIETMVKGMDNSTCFVIAEKWTPKALEASERGLQKNDSDADVEPPAYNCAALVASQWGLQMKRRFWWRVLQADWV